LDLFSGSGSCLVACEETNRNCFLVENDIDFAAASLKRFESLGYKIEKENE
jgi:DNA modification methylase